MPLSSTLAMLPDTADSRLLAELSSYAEDLSEASDAMEQAFGAGHDSPLWQPLTSYAVVAYTRAFAHSNVRAGLLAHVRLPEELVETHDMIRGYRNTTVAHSQSELSMSLPLAMLTPEGTVRQVVPITIRHNLPQSTARRIADAIDRMSALVSDVLQPLAERLTAGYREASPDTVAGWPVPELDHELAERFTGNSRRRRQPRFVAYWDDDLEPSGAEDDQP